MRFQRKTSEKTTRKVEKKTNVNKEKPKNYVVSNTGFVKINDNNGFAISKANKSKTTTAINYNTNNNEKETNIKKSDMIIKKEPRKIIRKNGA